MEKALKITREEANEIISEHMQHNNDYAKVVVCWKAQWYDIRALDEKEQWAFISSLIGEPIKKHEVLTINLT